MAPHSTTGLLPVDVMKSLASIAQFTPTIPCDWGRANTDFRSHDIVTGGGDKVSYRGAHAGVRLNFPLTDVTTLESSVRYLYTALDADSIHVDGDMVRFNTVTSSRVQLSETVSLNLTATYEYEFDSRANARIHGFYIEAPNEQGATGIINAGIRLTPFDNKDN